MEKVISVKRYPQYVALICGTLFITGCNTMSPMTVAAPVSIQPAQINTAARNQATFALAKIVADLKRGAIVGRFPAGGVNGVSGTLCNVETSGEGIIRWDSRSSEFGNWHTELPDVFHEALSQSGLNIASDSKNLFGQSPAAQSAEYLIGGRITNIASNVCQVYNFMGGYPVDRYGGEMSIDVDWTVFSTLTQREVLTFRTQGYYQESRTSRDGVLLMFHGAFAEATKNLLASKEFVAIALRQDNPDARIAQFQGDDISITVRPQAHARIQDQTDSVLSAVATIRTGQGHGSGFFVSENGYLLTNAHVVGQAQNIGVVLSNGLEIPGKVIRRVENPDVALISVALRVPNALPIRTEPAKRLERIYVVGTPVDESLRSTVTSGIVSGTREYGQTSFIQADAPISPGNSGGPLLDEYGNVLGLSVAKIALQGSEGLGLFVPITDALNALRIRTDTEPSS